MKTASNGKVVMPERLSAWQALFTPLSLRANADFERARRAYRLTRRFDAAVQAARRRYQDALRASRARNEDESPGDPTSLLELALLAKHLSVLDALSSEANGSGGSYRVVLSSWMLRDSFEYCTRDNREGLHYVLGIEHEGMRIGTHLRTFPYAVQTPVAAEGDIRATHDIAIQTHEAGHVLVAMIHSHPGRGRGANHPSSVDMRTQRLLELTTPCVGGIWARDGNLRFYTHNLSAEIEIVGTHMEQNDDGTWQLVSIES